MICCRFKKEILHLNKDLAVFFLNISHPRLPGRIGYWYVFCKIVNFLEENKYIRPWCDGGGVESARVHFSLLSKYSQHAG